jgi:hypothetical protein
MTPRVTIDLTEKLGPNEEKDFIIKQNNLELIKLRQNSKIMLQKIRDMKKEMETQRLT